jgi:hypothetical protein
MRLFKSAPRDESGGTAATLEPVAPVPGDKWAPMSSGTCDLCNDDIGPGGARVPCDEFKELTRVGLEPRGVARKFMNAIAMPLEGWRQTVEQDTTDWGLCSECADAAREVRSGHYTTHAVS